MASKGYIFSQLWKSATVVLEREAAGQRMAGAEPYELQIDVKGSKAIDDNQLNIVDNSFNNHQIGTRLVFKREENARSKPLSHAKNDKLFQNNEVIDHLAKERESRPRVAAPLQ